ncbi:hypothetical protein BCR42DRAFT_51969 [Absidia repens]|uniref:Uncharacterized protein n=1 Tax=Absidia repens TaxID=90262 RepID=A0A1X2IFA3_9FUNG|nr:hypothetical protein BCR42DRAFT_51969 [Absidia repens]
MISNTTAATGNTTSGPVTIGFSPDETMTPLQQASWIVYLGFFFDLESNAYNVYENNIQQQYTCRKDNVANAGAKTIAITHYDKNEWSLLQNNNSYYSTLISDAGMTAFNGTMSNLHETDYVIDVSPSQTFVYGYSTWLQLVATYDQNTQVFTSKKNVFRIDGLINADGALGKSGHGLNCIYK